MSERGERQIGALVFVCAALVVIWTGHAMVRSLERAAARPEVSPFLFPSQWRLGGPQESALRSLTRQIERGAAPGSIVRVSVHSVAPADALVLRLWLAYLLPRYDIRAVEDASGSAVSEPEYALDMVSVTGDQVPPEPLPVGARLLEAAAGSPWRGALRGELSMAPDPPEASTSGVSTLGALVVLLGLLLLAGIGGSPRHLPPGLRLSVAFTIGLFGLHLLLSVYDAADVLWRRWPLLVGLAGLSALSVAAYLKTKSSPAGRRAGNNQQTRALVSPGCLRSSWGMALALVAVSLFAWVALDLRAAHSDFVYHWGIKGKRYLQEGAVDRSFLRSPGAWVYHPDYPNLLPETFVATGAIGQGLNSRGAERTVMLWSPMFLALIVLTCRSTLSSCGARPLVRETCTAAVGLGTAAFSIEYYQAAGPDLPLSLMFTLGAAWLLRSPRDRAPSWREVVAVAAIAGSAAAIKIEGVVFAALFMLLWSIRVSSGRAGDRREGGSIRRLVFLDRQRAARCLVAVGLTVVAILPWWLDTARLDLLQQGLSLPQWDRLGIVLRTVAGELVDAEWQGLPLVVLALPLLVLVRRTRVLALLIVFQLGFYGFVYLTSPHEPAYYVISTLPRLMLHLVPALFIASSVALPALPVRREARGPT